jgi:hypothetical protein
MACEKAKGLYVEGEVFGRALDPKLGIALARQRVIRAIDFGDRKLGCVVSKPVFRRFYGRRIKEAAVDKGFFRSRKLCLLGCCPSPTHLLES